MKIFAYILVLIVLTLTLTPCIDKPLNYHADLTEFAKHSEDSHQQDIDHCSPFCTCQCCQTSLHVPLLFSVNFSQTTDRNFSCYIENHKYIFIFKFHTPPKA